MNKSAVLCCSCATLMKKVTKDVGYGVKNYERTMEG
jgi:hypothetical protein